MNYPADDRVLRRGEGMLPNFLVDDSKALLQDGVVEGVGQTHGVAAFWESGRAAQSDSR